MTTGQPVGRPRRRRAIVVLLVAVVGVAVAVAALGVGLQPRPGLPAEAAVPPRAPLIVSVSHAGDPVANVGFPTSITVRALGGAPITSIELWAGARRLAEASNVGGGPAQVARWSWTPAASGRAVLVARATDETGRQAQSAPLRLTVDADAPTARPVRQVVVEEGESALAAARRVGGETTDLARWNAGLDPSAPLEAGLTIFVPLAVTEIPRPSGGEEIASVAGLGPWPFMDASTRVGMATLASWSGAGPTVTVGPSAEGTGLFVPAEVAPSVEDCTIKLAVSSDASNATGLAVYGLGPDSAAFSRVATFDPGESSTWAAPAPPGDYLFSVATFDGAAEEHGDLLAVEVPPECADQGWTGGARIEGGDLVVGADVDRAYLYLSLDDGPWQRLPANPGEFVEREGGRLDFTAHLPPDLASHRVDVEAWGWQGGSLLDVGDGHLDPAAPVGSPPAPPAAGSGGSDLFAGGTFTTLDWITHAFVPGTSEFTKEELLLRDGSLAVWNAQGIVKTELERTFRWLTNATGVDALVWQVAAFPMPTDLAPDVPGVLLQQVLPLADGTQGGDFPIDFRPIFAPPVQTASIGDATNGGIVQQLDLAQLGAIASAPPSPLAPAAVGTGASSGQVAGSSSGVYSPSWLLAGFTPSVLYIRAIPMDGTKVAASVSNFVRLDVTGDELGVFDPSQATPTSPKPAPSTATLKPYQLYVQLLPPANANPQFAGCVMVTGFEAGAVVFGKLEPGDFFCKVYPSTSGWTLAGAFDDFVDYVADAWDAVAGAWSWLQAQLASAIAKYSGCSSIAGGGFCEGLAKVAISVALTAAGIPPSLPNTEELIALGKGELKAALVDLASDAVYSLTGVDPCSAAELAKQGLGTDSCDDIAAQLIDDLVAQLATLKTQEAAAVTGVQVPPGVNVVPHPWGRLRPPRFRLTIARNVAVPLPTTGECRMTLSMGATVSNWTHKGWNETTGWGTVTSTVSGAPFSALTVAVPNPETASTPVFELPSTLGPDATVYEILLAALNKKLVTNRDYYLVEPAFWREADNPAQLYVAGKGYVSQVDQSNRAWVLLQNGTPVKGQVARSPGSPDCFDGVVVAGQIPGIDQGFPCTPTYGAWWQTVSEPFTGPPTQIAACTWMYAQATGY